MPTHKKPAPKVRIGGKSVPIVRAALICLEADRLHVTPGKVARVTVPDPAPMQVEVAGLTLSLDVAAQVAAAADALGVTPYQAIVTILEAHCAQLRERKRSRRRDTRRTLGAWMLRSR